MPTPIPSTKYLLKMKAVFAVMNSNEKNSGLNGI